MNIGSKEIFDEGIKPYDAKVEWLKSDGNQFIEIPVCVAGANDSVEINIVCDATGTNDDSVFCGNFKYNEYANSRFSLGFYNKFLYSYAVCSDTANRLETSIIAKDTVCDIKLKLDIVNKTRTLKFQNFEKSIATNWQVQNPLNIMLFRGRFETASIYKQPIRKVVIAKDKHVVFDGYFVRVGLVGYLYDEVSHQLFGNAGTGNFIVGPDIK